MDLTLKDVYNSLLNANGNDKALYPGSQV